MSHYWRKNGKFIRRNGNYCRQPSCPCACDVDSITGLQITFTGYDAHPDPVACQQPCPNIPYSVKLDVIEVDGTYTMYTHRNLPGPIPGTRLLIFGFAATGGNTTPLIAYGRVFDLRPGIDEICPTHPSTRLAGAVLWVVYIYIWASDCSIARVCANSDYRADFVAPILFYSHTNTKLSRYNSVYCGHQTVVDRESSVDTSATRFDQSTVYEGDVIPNATPSNVHGDDGIYGRSQSNNKYRSASFLNGEIQFNFIRS